MKRSRSSDASRFPSLRSGVKPTTNKSTSSSYSNFCDLPSDILNKIAASFNSPDLKSASSVCKSWRDALQPLRAAMLYFMWGKRVKHGTDAVERDLDKALDCFLKGVSLGSILCMIDAGGVYSKLGKQKEAIAMYTRAAELGDPASQLNLGISLLTVDTANPKEAVRWLKKASAAGRVRAQYQLALCLQKGHGVQQNHSEAAKWFLRAAEGGSVRAMYKLSHCYDRGIGLPQSNQDAEVWMRRAAECGHSEAQVEQGLTELSYGCVVDAAVYLELASRAGETSAVNMRDVVLGQMLDGTRALVQGLVDCWRPQRRRQIRASDTSSSILGACRP